MGWPNTQYNKLDSYHTKELRFASCEVAVR
jgi:hypothetical protein